MKLSTSYICQQCGFKSSQYFGKCPECGTWNSLVETVEEVVPTGKAGRKPAGDRAEIVNLSDLTNQSFKRLSSGFQEFDRVLGGGIVYGSVVLVSGDPGIGKSTLLLQLALNVNKASGNVLYIGGEESAQQIKIRAERIEKSAQLQVLNEIDVDLIIQAITKAKPGLVIIDSIQTLETQDLSSPPGSIGQVRESAHRLHNIAKRLHIPMMIVGHVTKDGSVAGPRTLEHLVDTVLTLEGDPATNFRILRGIKNRFGPTDEVGIFEMEENGLIEVTNPSKLFLEQKVNAPGSAVVAIVNGVRPLLIEIQALTTKSFLPMPKRVGSGIDGNRLQLLVAVLSKRLGLSLSDQDIFVNVTGGIRVVEPAADLGICLAILSSFKNLPLPKNSVFIGEVGLLGELRAVRAVDKRTAEAKKLGFTQVVSSSEVKSLDQAWKLVSKSIVNSD